MIVQIRNTSKSLFDRGLPYQQLIKFRYVPFFLSGITIWKLQAVNLASAPNGVDSAYYTSYIANGDVMNDYFSQDFNYFWTRSVPIMIGRQFHLVFGSVEGYSLLRYFLVGCISLTVSEFAFQLSKKFYPSCSVGLIVVGLPIGAYAITNDYVTFMAWPLYVIAITLLTYQPFTRSKKSFISLGAIIGTLASFLLFSYPGPIPLLALSVLVSASFSILNGKTFISLIAMFVSMLSAFIISNLLVSKLATNLYGAQDLLTSSFQWMIQISKSQLIADYFHTDGIVWLYAATSLGLLGVGISLSAFIMLSRSTLFEDLIVPKSALSVLSTIVLVTGAFVAVQQFVIGQGVLEIAVSVTFILAPTLILLSLLFANSSKSLGSLFVIVIGLALLPNLPRIVFPLWTIGLALAVVVIIVTSLSLKVRWTSGAILVVCSLAGVTSLLFGHTTEITPGAANIAGPNYKVSYEETDYLANREVGVNATHLLLEDVNSKSHLFVWLQPASGEEAIQVASSFLWGNGEHSLREGVDSIGSKDLIRIKNLKKPMTIIVVSKSDYSEELILRDLRLAGKKIEQKKCFAKSNTKFCSIRIT